jgi:hypothetical protein
MMKRLMITALAAWVALGGGCATPPAGGLGAGVGVYVFANGEAKAIAPVPLGQAQDAVLEVVNELRYRIVSKSQDGPSAELKARDALDREIVINLQEQAEDSTGIDIRVGESGDEAMSRMILERIRKRF